MIDLAQVAYFSDNLFSLILLVVLLGIFIREYYQKKFKKFFFFFVLILLIFLNFILDIFIYRLILPFDLKIIHAITGVIILFYFLFVSIFIWKFLDKPLLFSNISVVIIAIIFDFIYTFTESSLALIFRSIFSILIYILFYFLTIKFFIEVEKHEEI